MNNEEKIKKFESFLYDNYASVSSREKLVAYVIKYLNERNIQTTYNNICISAFKLFPEKFYFSEEFKEYPHIEMLNRTLLHLRPKERGYATGSSRSDYILTSLGEEIADQVDREINKEYHIQAEKEVMDKHKNTTLNDYNKIISSREYKEYELNNILDINMMWTFFEVTPYTQIEKIKKYLLNLKKYVIEIKDEKCEMFIEQLLNFFK